MIKEINREIEIPSGIEVEIETKKAIIKGGEKALKKNIPFSNKIDVIKRGNLINITSKKPTKRERALAGTIEAHIRNAICGLEKEYLYKLEICNVHFPMNVKIDGKRIIIKNFLGEKVDRAAEILEGVSVSLKGNILEVRSADKDAAGQTAANLEKATNIRNRDRRVFQDGIYIIEKEGKPI